ncbi:MAG: hypothetical protein AAFX06_34060 [Planctomycetota bacterium]
MPNDYILLWSVRISLLAYVANIALLATNRHESLRRWINLSGVVLIVVHVIWAYASHDFSHSKALQQTATDTQQTLGFEFAAGIYFNHLFVLLWMLEVMGDWTRFAFRPRVRLALHGYLMLIAFNGAIVFENGATRWIGLVVIVALGGLVMSQRRRRPIEE